MRSQHSTDSATTSEVYEYQCIDSTVVWVTQPLTLSMTSCLTIFDWVNTNFDISKDRKLKNM